MPDVEIIKPLDHPPDTHIPFHDKRSLKAVEKLMADYRFDGWLHIGDLAGFQLHNLTQHRQSPGS